MLYLRRVRVHPCTGANEGRGGKKRERRYPVSLNVKEGKEWKVKKAGASKVRTDRIWRYSECTALQPQIQTRSTCSGGSISRSKSQTRSVAAARNKRRALSQLMSDRSQLIVSFPGITGYRLMLSFVSLPIDFIQNGFESEGDHTERERKTHTRP